MGPLSAPEKPKDFANVMDLVGPLSNVDATLELFVGQARTLTLKKPVSEGKSVGVVALGDPSIADFEILPNPRIPRCQHQNLAIERKHRT